MRKVDTSRAAKIVVVTGKSGSGKSAWTKKQISRSSRLIIWDIDDEYSGAVKGIKRITNIKELASELKKTVRGKFAFVGAVSDFDLFCRCAFAWGDCVCVVEELADVTSPGKAPPAWGQLVRRGRKYGISIYAVTQRPAESDKTIIGNASLLHVCQMQKATDRRYMAAEMDISQTEIDQLKPLEYIEKNSAGEIKRGKITF
ncbi:MAG: hypothetical protein IBX55_18640 [Methyloprofundus sp.]|nr:hypothetical protein [Methyloprofundus sp.]